MIFYHDINNPYEGCDLILHDKDNTLKIIFESSKCNENTMIIFSIDLFHEVTPITKGTRHVLKKPLFVTVTVVISGLNDYDDICDGSLHEQVNCDSDGDY